MPIACTRWRIEVADDAVPTFVVKGDGKTVWVEFGDMLYPLFRAMFDAASAVEQEGGEVARVCHICGKRSDEAGDVLCSSGDHKRPTCDTLAAEVRSFAERQQPGGSVPNILDALDPPVSDTQGEGEVVAWQQRHRMWGTGEWSHWLTIPAWDGWRNPDNEYRALVPESTLTAERKRARDLQLQLATRDYAGDSAIARCDYLEARVTELEGLLDQRSHDVGLYALRMEQAQQQRDEAQSQVEQLRARVEQLREGQ